MTDLRQGEGEEGAMQKSLEPPAPRPGVSGKGAGGAGILTLSDWPPQGSQGTHMPPSWAFAPLI